MPGEDEITLKDLWDEIHTVRGEMIDSSQRINDKVDGLAKYVREREDKMCDDKDEAHNSLDARIKKLEQWKIDALGRIWVFSTLSTVSAVMWLAHLTGIVPTI